MVAIQQKVSSKSDKIKLNRSRLLGTLLSNQVTTVYAEDKRSHTGVIKDFDWSVFKELKPDSKFSKSSEKDPLEAETGFNEKIHSHFISECKDLEYFNQYGVGETIHLQISGG